MLTMMIIDDEAIIRESLNRFVDWNSIGIKVTGLAANGSLALDLIQEDAPDIILSDINMPMLNGLELLEFLRLHHIPSEVIFISAYSKFEYAQAAIRLGAFDYVLKPIDEENLLKVVDKCAKKVLADRGRDEHMRSMTEDNTALLASVLRHMYYDEHYEISDADRSLLLESGISAAKYKTMISAGIWYPAIPKLMAKDYEPFFGNIPSACRLFVFSLEENLHALLLLSEEIDVGILESSFFQVLEEIRKTLLTELASKSISMSCAYPYSDSLDRLYTESALAHLLQNSNSTQEISTFKDVRSRSNHLNDAYQNENLIQLIKEIDAAELPALLQQIFLSFVRSQVIYDLNFLKLHCIDLIDSLIDDLKEFQLHTYLSTDGLSAKKSVNSQESIGGIYEVTKNILQNLIRCVSKIKNKNSTQLVRAVLEYIHEHYGEDISLTQIARQLYVSSTYLSKLFSSEVGQPFSKYLLEYKIKMSRELLQNPQLKVYDIAAQCGFSDIAHFSKAFKQIVGVSPHKYRNRN